MNSRKTEFSISSAITVVLALAIGGLTSSEAAARTFRFDYNKELAIESGAILRIQNAEGAITVKGQPGLDHLVIQAVKTVHAVDETAAQEVAGFIKLKLTATKQVARVETIVEKVEHQQRSFWQRLVGSDDDWFESVEYVITAPTETSVMIIGAGGAIDISSITGNLDISVPSSIMTLANVSGDALLDVTSGEITIRETSGSVDLTSTRANVSVTSLVGDLTVNGGAGDLNCEYLEGAVNVVQTSGDVTLERFRGDARVKVTSGKVTIEQEMGALDIYTHTGVVDIYTDLFSERDYVVETLSGDISFVFSDNTGASVSLATLSGKIDTRGLPLDVETFSRQEIHGDVAGGGVRVTLKSDAGDILLGWR